MARTDTASRVIDAPPQTVYAALVDREALAGSEIVIEAAPERFELKSEIFRTLDAILPGKAILATNTSSISITKLASITHRPAQVIGMHFFNPVPVMTLVEVVRGMATSDATFAAVRDLAVRLGKTPVEVNDAPGFVSNRVLMLTVNEAIWTVQDQVAKPEDVDRIFKSCFGHRMGPLETGDLIGLDTILLTLEVLQDSYGDDKFRPCPLLRKMVDAGEQSDSEKSAGGARDEGSDSRIYQSFGD